MALDPKLIIGAAVLGFFFLGDKKSTKSKYKTFNIDNLNLYMNPQNMFNYKTGALVMVLLAIILFLIYKRY